MRNQDMPSIKRLLHFGALLIRSRRHAGKKSGCAGLLRYGPWQTCVSMRMSVNMSMQGEGSRILCSLSICTCSGSSGAALCGSAVSFVCTHHLFHDLLLHSSRSGQQVMLSKLCFLIILSSPRRKMWQGLMIRKLWGLSLMCDPRFSC